MSVYHPSCPHNPCPICGDTSGDCSISEYGYVLDCRHNHLPGTQEGELRGFWKCFRSHKEYSQWEDQRVVLEVQIKPAPQITVTFHEVGGESIEIIEVNSEKFTSFLDESVSRAIDRHEGKGGES